MKLLDTAIEVASGASALLKKGFGTSFEIQSKEGKQNLVTEYDLASQAYIINELKKAFPKHHFLAEENGAQEAPSDEILWIIDPLDGTVNFAHGIPFFAISIAAAKGKEIVAGVVHQPMLDEWFVAEKGAGAFLGKDPLHVSRQTKLEGALLATGFPYNVDENPLRCIDRFQAFVEQGVPVRRIGVAALDLAYVAAGRFDAFWEVSLHPWDIAAGKLLVEEAGGLVTHYDGSEHPIFSYHPIVASNGHLHSALVDRLKEDLL